MRCAECVTGRHLLERTVAAVHQSLQAAGDGVAKDYNPRCENLSALVVHLQRLLKSEEKFVLVLDGVDKQREAPPTLLPALARLGEFVRLPITHRAELQLTEVPRCPISRPCSSSPTLQPARSITPV